MTARRDLLVMAATAAVERVRAVRVEDGVEALFAPLGEALTWVEALTDLRKMRGVDLLLGLGHARNAVVHGHNVVTAAKSGIDKFGSEPGLFVPGLSMLGTITTYTWGFVDSASLPAPGRGSAVQKAERLRAYDAEVAGRKVVPLLERALTIVG